MREKRLRQVMLSSVAVAAGLWLAYTQLTGPHGLAALHPNMPVYVQRPVGWRLVAGGLAMTASLGLLGISRGRPVWKYAIWGGVVLLYGSLLLIRSEFFGLDVWSFSTPIKPY